MLTSRFVIAAASSTPPDPTELLENLVAFDTTSHLSNLPLVDWATDRIALPGVRVERFLNEAGTKVTLLASCGPVATMAREGLVLCGHTDVVPAGEGWTSEPFRLSDRGDTWVARGACDMKGFLALAIERFVIAAQSPERLRAPLALLFTDDEEVGTLGAQRFVTQFRERREELPRSVLIGEPTSLRVVRLHKGHTKLRVDIHGRSAHSSLPHLGRNAIEIAGRVLAELVRLRLELETEREVSSESFREVPFVTLNVGRIAGGGAVNVVPDRCVIDIGLRPLPGTDAVALRERVIEAVRRVAPEAAEVTELGASPPLTTEPTSPLVRLLRQEAGDSSDAGLPFASDGGPLQALGCEPVLFGPGSIAVAHRPDEFLPKAEFVVAGGILERVVHRMCVAPELPAP